MSITAPRGIIYDRNGIPLVDNMVILPCLLKFATLDTLGRKTSIDNPINLWHKAKLDPNENDVIAIKSQFWLLNFLLAT